MTMRWLRIRAVRARGGPLLRFRRCVIVGVALVIGGCAGMAVPGTEAATSPVRMAVIGDSLSTGLQTPGELWTGEAQRLLGADGHLVQIVNAAENGAGYVARGEHGDRFVDQVDQVVNTRTQVVVVFGSDNDLGLPHLAAGVSNTLERIRAVAPHAALIVIGPPAPPAQSPESLAVIRDALRAATLTIHGQFVDPLMLKWFQGEDSRFVSSDQEHPDGAGERYLAQQMIEVLTPTVTRLSFRAKSV